MYMTRPPDAPLSDLKQLRLVKWEIWRCQLRNVLYEIRNDDERRGQSSLGKWSELGGVNEGPICLRPEVVALHPTRFSCDATKIVNFKLTFTLNS